MERAYSDINKCHFILTSDELYYLYYLSVMSAIKTQKTSRFILWAFKEPTGDYWQFLKDKVELNIIDKPDFPALRNKPLPFQYAHLKDHVQWDILYNHGGLYLDLDNFCVADIFELWNDDKDLLVNLVKDGKVIPENLYHIGCMMVKPQLDVMKQVGLEATNLLLGDDITWGKTGPPLFSQIVYDNHSKVNVVERGVLGGNGIKVWGSKSIFSPGKLWEKAKLVHIYAGKRANILQSINEEYIANNPSLYAELVRATLSREEWYPSVEKIKGDNIMQHDHEMCVHFVTTGPEFSYIYYLGIMTAIKVYGGKVVLWYTEEPKSKYFNMLKFNKLEKIKMEKVDVPVFPALATKDLPFQRTAIFDYVVWNAAYNYGGMIMGLDSLTLKPHFDLLHPDKEMLAPIDAPGTIYAGMHGVIVRKNSPLAKTIIDRSISFLNNTERKFEWGDSGMSSYCYHIPLNLDKISFAPFKMVCGRHLDLFKENSAMPHADTRTIALYGSSIKQGVDIDEAYINTSQSPYAKIVRKILTKEEWNGHLWGPPGVNGAIEQPSNNEHSGESSNVGSSSVGDTGPCLQVFEKGKMIASIDDSNLLSPPEDPGPPGFIPKYRPSGLTFRHKIFHLPGLPHIATNKNEALACAFSQKVIKMAKMLKSLGHTVYFYGVEGSEVECDEYIQVSTQAILKQAYGDYDTKKETYRHGIDNIATKTFNENCITEIRKRMESNDFLLIPFSPGIYRQLIDTLSNKFINIGDGLYLIVEMGIGYRGTYCPFRVWESSSQMHFEYGLESSSVEYGGRKNGGNYDVVIPNYFDPDDFTYSEDKEDYFLYLGRIITRKGVSRAIQVTQEIGAKLIVAGQKSGKIIDLTSPHVEDFGFANLEDRRRLLSKAKGVFLPTWYIEPFGGVCIEAALSGTPVITSDFGAFVELVIHDKTGYRCRTLDHYVWAAKNINTIKPIDCYNYAMANFTLDRVKLMYEEYFDMLLDVKEGKGWGCLHPERTSLDWLVRSR